MVITRWRGGLDGLEIMPTGRTTLSFTEIWMEVPSGLSPIGYYDPLQSGPFLTNSPHRFGSLSVYINNIKVVSTSLNTSSFTIDHDGEGYVRVCYAPDAEADYFGSPLQIQYPYSPLRTRTSPSKREHITEILAAITRISETTNAPRAKFSIEPGTGLPMTFNDAIGVDGTTPVLSQLFDEINRYIIYLYEFGVSLGASLLIPTFVSYTAQHVRAATIVQMRDAINSLEAALEGIGM